MELSITNNMKREIDARKAIHKLKEAQLSLYAVHDACLLVGYNEVNDIVKSIQEIKVRLDRVSSKEEGVETFV